VVRDVSGPSTRTPGGDHCSRPLQYPLRQRSVNSHFCQASTCLRIGSKFRCIRSTPTEIQSMSENDFECFASTGVNTPEIMSPDSGSVRFDFLEADFWLASTDVPHPWFPLTST